MGSMVPSSPMDAHGTQDGPYGPRGVECQGVHTPIRLSSSHCIQQKFVLYETSRLCGHTAIQTLCLRGTVMIKQLETVASDGFEETKLSNTSA